MKSLLRRVSVRSVPVSDKCAASVQPSVLVANDGDVLERTKGIKGRENVLFVEILGDL